MTTQPEEPAHDRDRWNACRFVPGAAGHYESYFQRANHPDRPLAFWIRYTIFSPKDRPGDAIGELWAIWFDGESGTITAAKEEHPIEGCTFSNDSLNATIAGATLDGSTLAGSAASDQHQLDWSLTYTSPAAPLLLFPESFYERSLPKAKALVGSPHARFDGSITVDGTEHTIDGWIGSQNHNWGTKHTDLYAWGQVAGFDDAPDAFLEVATARIRLGPLWSPWMTPIVLRLDGRQHALNTLWRCVRATADFDYFSWRFRSEDVGVRIHGSIEAPALSFVGLRYLNPPRGVKTCLNSKLARCEITVERPGIPTRTLTTAHRAAFEILTDDVTHGVPVVA